jgi:short-subunit dehydrogenase
MKKAIIIGASSGIGKELTKLFASHGYEVGIAARRIELLNNLASEIPAKTYTAAIDVNNTEIARQSLDRLIGEMENVETIVICAGTGYLNPSLDWFREKETIDTNVTGFTAMAGTAMKYFISRNSGHLVVISSIAGIRGSHICPAYNASKAFVSNYLEGLRKKAAKEKLSITITDIQPGLVDTAMAKGEGLFWVASPQKTAKQIFGAIQHKKRKAYVTRRWALVAWLLKIVPESIYNKI